MRDRSVRTTFDDVAEIYDEVRPGYPEQIIEDIIALSGIPEKGDILEIGCGTGQATHPFAARGYEIHCLDIGRNMVDIARQKFQNFKNVEIELASFEDWEPAGRKFDMVLSATAFHWIPSDIGFPKSVQILDDGGSLVLLSHLHPSPYTGFFERVQEIYQEIVPEWKDPRTGISSEEKVRLGEENINTTGLFEPVIKRTYDWTAEFDSVQYLKLLNTFSGHLALSEQTKARLFKAISDLINDEYGGVISRPYLTVLYIAKPKSITF